MLLLALHASAMAARPRVGVGVFVRSASHPGAVLLGRRRGSAGAGTLALPGGHLEFGESWAECAAREVLEETGLAVTGVRTGTVINSVEAATSYHYVVVLMVCDAPPGAEPENLEPEKCDGWAWHAWAGVSAGDNLFGPLSKLVGMGFDPWRDEGTLPALAQEAELPPYCCALLRDEASGALFFESRPADAKVAAGKLTCFGGKREPAEAPADCLLRECKEELGWVPDAAQLRRACDLYVDGRLIAWFYEAPGPPADAPLSFEPGRRGVWLAPADDMAGVSPWHACVLRAWRQGQRRADFTS